LKVLRRRKKRKRVFFMGKRTSSTPSLKGQLQERGEMRMFAHRMKKGRGRGSPPSSRKKKGIGFHGKLGKGKTILPEKREG